VCLHFTSDIICWRTNSSLCSTYSVHLSFTVTKITTKRSTSSMSLSVLTWMLLLLSQYCCMTTSFSPFQSWVGLLHSKPLYSSSTKQDSSTLSNVSMKYPLLNDLIIRAARGEVVERTPVKLSVLFQFHVTCYLSSTNDPYNAL
jgi:hypothetical protein